MEGVYVVSPTAEAVDLIKRDFRSHSEALYCKVHLFFLEGVPRELMHSLKQCSALVSRIKTFKVLCITLCTFCGWSYVTLLVFVCFRGGF